MIYLLCGVCAVLLVAVCVLSAFIAGMRRAAGELRDQFAARRDLDTNVGIDISTSDRKMRALARDIDRELKALRRAQIRYTRGDQELKDAVMNVSHDLRTPLTAICGYMELLRQAELPEQARGYLNIIENRIEAMKQLSEELFRYSVVLSTDSNGGGERVRLNQALEECVAGYYGALKGKGIAPEISIPDKPIERELNRAALSRVLGNVMINAVKYSAGDLRIALSEQGAITFSNRADQLDEVTVGRLFDRFYTVENGRNGTGLGLSIAKALTEQMGGTIAASKENGVFSIEIRFPEGEM